MKHSTRKKTGSAGKKKRPSGVKAVTRKTTYYKTGMASGKKKSTKNKKKSSKKGAKKSSKKRTKKGSKKK